MRFHTNAKKESEVHMRYTAEKIKRRLRREVFSRMRSTPMYPYLYRSMWHKLFYIKKSKIETVSRYFAACPNPGAGIGHQMANWIAGYWFAKLFGLNFAHIAFSTPKWETFLGFGENEVKIHELIEKGYKKVRLPLFLETNRQELTRIHSIIDAYSGRKVVFVCEQDQYYKDQFGVMEDLQNKFFNAKAREKDQLIFSKDHYSVAIHVRRGDIVIGQENKNPNLMMRWQNNTYFSNVLTNYLKTLQTEKEIAIYLFSQGEESDFEDFKHFPNLHFCLDMNAQDSFLHMVYADCLITSKSSFSYKPALLNKGTKVCPKDFWHGYPTTNDWILAENDGELIHKALSI
jgi:hypothetical protein